MSQADSPHNTIASGGPLSALFVDHFVADAFRRAERGRGGAFAVPAPSGPVLVGGAAAVPAGEAGEAIPLTGCFAPRCGKTNARTEP